VNSADSGPPPSAGESPAAHPNPSTTGTPGVAWWLYAVFFLSGTAALIYQIAWQRALFAVYGLDILSVTVVVTAFMLGLGLGSLLGGALSKIWPRSAIPLFAVSELGIGAFGFFSVSLFQKVAASTGGLGHLATGVVAFFLVVIPTTLMGATLPLLVAHATNRSGNVGRSVGNLYFVNTLGAAFGAYLTVRVLLGLLGLSATVQATAGLNASLGLFVLACHWPKRRAA
jgi:predicted membrane-bound spermidine synthase